MNNSKKLNVLSLFTGCGGMDLGFEGGFNVLTKSVNLNINAHWVVKPDGDSWLRLPKTRFRMVFANDIKPSAKRVWASNFLRFGYSASQYRTTSVVDLVKAYHSGDRSVFPQNIDVVTGGFPCQDFSVAGKRLGFSSTKSHMGLTDEGASTGNENRGKLYLWMKEVISLTKPKVFVAENVKGLANLANAKKIIEDDFSNIAQGYIVIPAKILLASRYGVPQSRERVIFYGLNKAMMKPEAVEALSGDQIIPQYDPYPVPTHHDYRFGLPLDDKLYKYVDLRSAFNGLVEPELTRDIDQTKYSKVKYMGKHCQGQTEVDLDGVGPTIRSEHHGNIEYRRLSKKNGGTHIEELISGLKERRLTIRECARIQTFPDEFKFILPADQTGGAVSASEAYKLIGNAVPPLLAFHIAKRLEDNWELYFPN